MITHDVDATMPVALLKAQNFAYKWIPRLVQGWKNNVLQLKRTSMVVAYFNILQHER